MKYSNGGPRRVLLLDLVTGALVGGVTSAVAIDAFGSGSEHGLAIGFVLIVAEGISLLLSPISALSVLGTGALCLTVFLLEPIGSLEIASAAERTAILWMLAAGAPLCVAVSHTFLWKRAKGN
jgi:hypothetical protein